MANRSCSSQESGSVRAGLGCLALDVGLAGLALGIERVEGKVEVMLGRLAGVDGAARESADRLVHAARSTKSRTAGDNS